MSVAVKRRLSVVKRHVVAIQTIVKVKRYCRRRCLQNEIRHGEVSQVIDVLSVQVTPRCQTDCRR